MNKDIAAVILNETQLKNILPCIDELLLNGYKIDIYCNDPDNNEGFREMFSHTRKILISKGYNVYSSPQNCEYQVLLEPYPSGIDIKAKYKIRYRYGNISAKPNIVYKPESYIQYDAVLCAGKYDANYLSVFSKTYITAKPKYSNFKKKKSKYKKPVLLYLPTYGEESSVELIFEELKKLKSDYHIIVKLHHGTTFLKKEQYKIELLKNVVNELYDSSVDLAELLSIADLVLTDNSGSIFEAIYVEVPVAVFCDDINRNKQHNFNTVQYDLYVEGILPYTNNPKDLKTILKAATSNEYYTKQRKWAKENLYRPTNVTKDFVNTVIMFLNENIDKKYYEMHDYFKEYFFNLINNNESLKQEVIQKEKIIQDMESNLKNIQHKNKMFRRRMRRKLQQNNHIINKLKKQLYYYETGKLYKFAKKIYELKNKGEK